MSDELLRAGVDLFSYYSTGTTYESPTWSLVDLISDESIDFSKGKAEFKTRGSKYKRKKGTTIEVPVSFSVEYRKGDAFIAKLIDSAVNGTMIDMAFMFDPIAEEGAEGIRMPIEVFDFPFNRPLEEGVVFEVGAELTEQLDENGDLVDFAWWTVPAS
ncbi:hypothetical protein [Roseiconus lacunae]|uniref:Tail tube protein n=1 Tax=Roseiconus lacunae TaxID=2605694 RepID=A0ABT7PHI9_9BACT|nr:hypothetical protein [Roseiconus lacunae]MDM4015955.1 hypothetical protein [Roseiconus lacunae]